MCRLMDELIPPDLRHSVFGYLDDLVIVSEDFPTHIEMLMRISSQFRRANLTLNVSKSRFCVTKVNYLGYVIGNGGITTDIEKITAISQWPVPKTLKQVRGFLGLAGWYRRFIQNFSSEVAPITNVLSTKKKFLWTEEAQKAFVRIKELLTSAPVSNLQLLRNDLRKRIKEAFDKNQKQYNLRARQQTFTVGQEVFRRNFAQSSIEKDSMLN